MKTPMYLPEMVSYDIAVIAKLMLWDTMFDKSRHRFYKILNQGEYLANLYHKENLDNLSHYLIK
jgi:hypothetical protein